MAPKRRAPKKSDIASQRAVFLSFVQWLVDEGSLLAQHCAANQDNPWFRMKNRLRRPVHTVALISTTWLFERLCSWRYMQQLQSLSEQEQQGSVGEADSAVTEAPAAAASATPVLEAAWYAMPSGERKSFTLFIRHYLLKRMGDSKRIKGQDHPSGSSEYYLMVPGGIQTLKDALVDINVNGLTPRRYPTSYHGYHNLSNGSEQTGMLELRPMDSPERSPTPGSTSPVEGTNLEVGEATNLAMGNMPEVATETREQDETPEPDYMPQPRPDHKAELEPDYSPPLRFAVKGMRTGGGRRQPEALDVLAEAAQEASVSAPQGAGPVATAAAFAAALGQYGALPGGLPMLGWASQGGQIAAAGMGMPQLAFYPNFQMPAGMAAYTAPTISGMDTMGGVAIGSMPMGSMPMGNMGIGGLAPAAGGQFAAQAMQVPMFCQGTLPGAAMAQNMMMQLGWGASVMPAQPVSMVPTASAMPEVSQAAEFKPMVPTQALAAAGSGAQAGVDATAAASSAGVRLVAGQGVSSMPASGSASAPPAASAERSQAVQQAAALARSAGPSSTKAPGSATPRSPLMALPANQALPVA
eukprot:jgi/Astpho2/6259/Aster-03660